MSRGKVAKADWRQNPPRKQPRRIDSKKLAREWNQAFENYFCRHRPWMRERSA